MPHPNDPKLRSFVPVAPASDFPIQNLPYGVFSAKGLAPRVGVAIGDHVLDLWELAQACRIDVVEPGVFAAPTLNAFMALGPKVWSKTRARISELLREDHPGGGHAMITATVRYKLPPHIDYAACREHFHKIAPGFREVKGLISKHYIWSESGWAGGVYQWERIEDAKAFYRGP